MFVGSVIWVSMYRSACIDQYILISLRGHRAMPWGTKHVISVESVGCSLLYNTAETNKSLGEAASERRRGTTTTVVLQQQHCSTVVLLRYYYSTNTVVLQYYYSTTTELIQYYYSIITALLQY